MRRQEQEQLQARRAALERGLEAQITQLRVEHEHKLKTLDQQLAQAALREQRWQNGEAALVQSRAGEPGGPQ